MNSFSWGLQWKFFSAEVEKGAVSTVEGAWKWRRKLDFKVRAVIGTVRGEGRADLIVQELIEYSWRFGTFIVYEQLVHWFSVRLVKSGNPKEAARHWLKEYVTLKESIFSPYNLALSRNLLHMFNIDNIGFSIECSSPPRQRYCPQVHETAVDH
jgi:hypothetical protein